MHRFLHIARTALQAASTLAAPEIMDGLTALPDGGQPVARVPPSGGRIPDAKPKPKPKTRKGKGTEGEEEAQEVEEEKKPRKKDAFLS